jgi:hypothetical protein
MVQPGDGLRKFRALGAPRYAASNSGSFIHLSSVFVAMPKDFAASSIVRFVKRAATASSFLRPNFAP